MPPKPITLQRLAQQRLAGNTLGSPEQVVAWMLAVQAQEYAGAKWSLGLRMAGVDDAAVEQAFNQGKILRTHVMRPTWHFVAPDDIRWLLELTARRVKMRMAIEDRTLELDEGQIRGGGELVARALEGGKHLSREELGKALEAGGIRTGGQRVGQILTHAELDGLVCSGPRRGKQFTYALLEERAPQARRLEREEALAELARRYFASHGPATVHDLAWWSGLTVGEARMGVELAAPETAAPKLAAPETAARSPLTLPSPQGERELLVPGSGEVPATPGAILLPTYDEFLVGYAGFDRARSGGGASGQGTRLQSRVILDGEVRGAWRRTLRKDAVRVEVEMFALPGVEEWQAVEAAAQRYGEFLGKAVEVIH